MNTSSKHTLHLRLRECRGTGFGRFQMIMELAVNLYILPISEATHKQYYQHECLKLS